MKTIRIIAIAVLILVGSNAVIAGFLFMTDPSGSELGLTVELLQYSPFENFFIPGIVLFIMIGINNSVAALYAIFQWKGWKFLLFAQGLVLFGWIIIQVTMLQQVHYLHVILASTALLLMVLSVLSNKKKRNE